MGDDAWGGIDITAVKVLVDHQRRDIGSCICGWGVGTGDLGHSHAVHVWRELQAAGVDRRHIPAAGDDTLREQLAEALTPLCDLPRIQHTNGNPGPCLHDRARADALLPLIREHVAALTAERDQATDTAAVRIGQLSNSRERAERAEAAVERARVIWREHAGMAWASQNCVCVGCRMGAALDGPEASDD